MSAMESKDENCCFISMVISIGLIFIAIVRVIYVIYQTGKPLRPKSPKPMSTLIVLGSGKFLIYCNSYELVNSLVDCVAMVLIDWML